MTAETRRRIQEEATKLGVKVRDCIAMSPNRDPFYIGSETDYVKANWFRDMWDQHGYIGLHLRGFHYTLQAFAGPDVLHPLPEAIRRPDGQPYLNTPACWSYLKDVFSVARFLGTIGFGVVRDKRSPFGEIWQDESYEYQPFPTTIDDGVLGVEYAPKIDWGSVEELAEREAKNQTEELFAAAYYDPRRYQPYYLSVWSEKDLDELRTACRGLANFVPNVGGATYENAMKDLQRIRTFGKPAIIFYLSDFDPKGMDMPVSISRFFEVKSNDESPRIRLLRLGVTPEQVLEFQIPRSPIKRGKAETTGTGARAYNTIRDIFQAVYGEGAVEMDALTSRQHRGTLRRWVRDALRPWIDWDLQERVEAALQDAREEVQRRIHDAVTEREGELSELRGTLAARIEELAQVHQETVRGLGLEGQMAQLHDVLDTISPDLDIEIEMPEGEAGGEEREWLLDTDRGYGEQIAAYKRYDMRCD